MISHLIMPIVGLIFLVSVGIFVPKQEQKDTDSIISGDDTQELVAISLMSDSFDVGGRLEESGKLDKSASERWWINSGGYMLFQNGTASTVRGELPETDKWKQLYAKNNPRDTDGGIHPQNIFRLVARGLWQNFTQEARFLVLADNLSESSFRNDSNGILFFNRYQDGDNLYYAGIRVDGYAVIKKKIKGKYFTLAYNRIFPGEYNREKNPNLLPHDTWLGLRSEVNNVGSDSVSIKLYLDRENNGNWELVAEAVDDGKKYGGKAITKAGHGGIRTDFMDVEFDDYRIEEK